MTNYALEALKFNYGSDVYKKLTQYCQELIDDDTPMADWPRSKVVKDFVNKVKLLIEATMKFRITKINIMPISEPFAATHLNYSGLSPYDTMRLQFRENINSYSDVSEKAKALFKQVADDQDPDTGVFREVQKVYTAQLYISYGLVHVSKSYAVKDFTAEELAAVILHEIGHTVDFVRTLAQKFQSTMVVDDIVDYLKSPPKDDAELRGRVAVIKDLFEDDAENRKYGEGLVAVSYVIGFLSLGLGYIPVVGFILSILTYIFSAIMASKIDSVIYAKLSDIMMTPALAVRHERQADNFATRMGAGKPLLSALAKLHYVMEAGRYKYLPEEKGRANLINVMFNVVKVSLASLSHHSLEYTSEYDPIIIRLKRIIMTNYAAINSSSVPESIKEALTQDTIQMKAELEKYDSARYVKTRTAIWKFFGIFKTAASVPLRVIMSTANTEYAKLQNTTDELVENSLGYQAQRVKSLT